jgi:hypothetical protein
MRNGAQSSYIPSLEFLIAVAHRETSYAVSSFWVMTEFLKNGDGFKTTYGDRRLFFS